jgi:hypothetical protein
VQQRGGNCCNQPVEIRVDFNQTPGHKVSAHYRCEHGKGQSSSRHPTSNGLEQEVFLSISRGEELLLESRTNISGGCCNSGDEYKLVKAINDSKQG